MGNESSVYNLQHELPEVDDTHAVSNHIAWDTTWDRHSNSSSGSEARAAEETDSENEETLYSFEPYYSHDFDLPALQYPFSGHILSDFLAPGEFDFPPSGSEDEDYDEYSNETGSDNGSYSEFEASDSEGEGADASETGACEHGGFEYDFVEDPPEEMHCPICLLVLRDPILTGCCGNHFCQSCIQQVRKQHKPCPLCKHRGFNIMLDKFFIRKVRELKVKCPNSAEGCVWTGEMGELQKHTDASGDCDFIPVLCDGGCGGQMQRHRLAEHRESECPNRMYVCEYCGFRATYKAVSTDHWSTCEKYPVCCPNKCETGSVERRLLKSHVGSCPLQEVECEFKFIGCAARLPREDMPRHLSESMSAHLAMVPKMHSDLQKKLNTRDRKIASLEAQVDRQKAELESMREKLKSQTPCSIPPVELVMGGFPYHKANCDQWFSQPFYSHPEGYKMCLSVFANGVGRGRSSHVSVFANLMSGENDSGLEWPFRGHVVVQIHYCNKSKEETLKFNARSPDAATSRVTHGSRNHFGQGNARCIAHSQLPYIPDCLRFRVSSVSLW